MGFREPAGTAVQVRGSLGPLQWQHATNLYLKPDGSYEDASETGYSGNFTDSGGYPTGAWGAVGQNQGQWTISGTLESGVIMLIGPGGGRTPIRYQVHVKDGEYYGGEYFFNGGLYAVNYIYRESAYR